MSGQGGRPFVRALRGLVLFAVVIVGASQLLYADRVLPGVSVGEVNLGGTSQADAAAAIAERAKPITELRFRHGDRTYTFSAAELGLEIDADATARTAMTAGRDDPVDAIRPFVLGLADYPSPLQYRLNRPALRQKLLDRTQDVTVPARDARVVARDDDFVTEPEADGSGIDVDQAVRDAGLAVEHFRTEVRLHDTVLKPDVVRSQLAPTLGEARFLATRPATIQAKDRTFVPDAATVGGWVGFRTEAESSGSDFMRTATPVPRFLSLVSIRPEELNGSDPGKRLVAEYDHESVGLYVRTVADAVDRPPVNGRLAFADGKITFSGESRDGLVVDRTAAVDAVISRTREGAVTELPVREEPAEVSPDNLDRLGLKTLIGSATTTYGGSPANRSYNIAVGARKFDGVLIKPGQEFSFNAQLGEVGPETGYVPELVILENRTEPQYGGGLCQVSTTMFRVALDSGLPITARTNHSYAVHYYAPIGMDATIYPPAPDMRFMNNTPGHILVQTSVAGQSITYQFFGTADGRKADAQILHINATEEGGGTASFRYVVTGGPDPVDRVFYSTYQPRKAFPLPGEQSLN